jgi:uncharacterized delta-60 repeat protein
LAAFYLGNYVKNPDEQVGCFQTALALRPKSAAAHNNLGSALVDKKNFDAALVHYRKAIEFDPKSAMAHYNLGDLLRLQNRLPEAEVAFQESIKRKIDYPQAYVNLGIVFLNQGKLTEAVEACNRAIDLQPTWPEPWSNKSNALRCQGKFSEAVEACRKAIELRPGNAGAYHNLGLVYYEQKKLSDAEIAFRDAIAHDANEAESHFWLGIVLRDRKKLSDAVDEFRKAIARKADNPAAHYQLGFALFNQQKLLPSIAAFRKATELLPDFAEAHLQLGNAYDDLGLVDQAIDAWEKAALKKDFALAHQNLSHGYISKQMWDQAIVASKRAIAIDPNLAGAHWNLGLSLKNQGQFADSLASLREAHRLASMQPGRSLPSVPLVRMVEQFLVYDAKLDKFLKAEIAPADTAERTVLAKLCALPSRQLYAAAVRFWTEAFAAEPALADDFDAHHRYDAACVAALAGCRQGKDTAELEPRECARLRTQALDWLRAHLAVNRSLFEKGGAKERLAVTKRMRHWQKDHDFIGVRGEMALAKLPEAERQEWHKLWREVDELRRLTLGSAGFGPEDGALLIDPTEGLYSAVKIQPNDRKIIAVGAGVARYNSLGNADTSYGSDGVAAVVGTNLAAFAIQADGKTIIANSVSPSKRGAGSDLTVRRLNADGTPDSSFGADGKAVVHLLDRPAGESPTSLALQSTGKIVVVGSTTQTPFEFPQFAAAARFTSGGVVDKGTDGFGDIVKGARAGRTLFKLGDQFNQFTDVAVQPDDNVVVVGSTLGGLHSLFVARYTAAGELDKTFNRGEGYSLILKPGGASRPTIALQTDGKIVVVAGIAGDDDPSDLLVARFNTDGTTDTSFGGGAGFVRLDVDGALTRTVESGKGVAIQPDGKIVAVGTVDTKILVARFNVDGTPDQTFAPGGFKLGVPPRDADQRSFVANGVALAADGSIIVAGHDVLVVSATTRINRPLLMRFFGSASQPR